jgi:hypothetical protein
MHRTGHIVLVLELVLIYVAGEYYSNKNRTLLLLILNACVE